MRGEGHQGGHLHPVLESNLRLTHFLWEGVKLDSDYSGYASLPNFYPSSLRGFVHL